LDAFAVAAEAVALFVAAAGGAVGVVAAVAAGVGEAAFGMGERDVREEGEEEGEQEEDSYSMHR
jgi:hypothetical protein